MISCRQSYKLFYQGSAKHNWPNCLDQSVYYRYFLSLENPRVILCLPEALEI